MAWPLSIFRTMVDGSTFWDAALGNALQNAVVGAYSGTSSLYSLVLDGVGGNSVVPNPAQLIVGPMPSLADYPLTIWNDKAGNSRGLVDHNGFRRGRVNEFYEDFMTIGPSTVGGASTVSTGRLNWNIPASSSLLLDSSQLSTSTGLRLTGTNVANSNVLRVNSSGGVVGNGNFVSSVQEFDVAPVALTNVDLIIGLISGPVGNGGTPTTVPYLALCKRSTDTNWQLLTGTGGTPNLVDTGVAPTSLDKILIEGHGSLSPYGAATARLFINGTLRATTTTAVPMTTGGGMLSMFIAMTTKSGTNSIDLSVSPYRATSNRYASAI